MAKVIGLSADQARYAKRLADGTGLDHDVARAWVVTASGNRVYRATHDYVGPRRPFRSTDHAAAHAARLFNQSPAAQYVRETPLVQLRAIGADRTWPQTFGQLINTWAELARELAGAPL